MSSFFKGFSHLLFHCAALLVHVSRQTEQFGSRVVLAVCLQTILRSSVAGHASYRDQHMQGRRKLERRLALLFLKTFQQRYLLFSRCTPCSKVERPGLQNIA
jgi:hypothetical protein